MVRRAVRWGAAVGFGAVWWWAALRLALGDGAGLVEGTVVAGGWAVSLLPVHCAAKGEAAGAVGVERWRAAWRAGRVNDAARRPRSSASDAS
ncbi:hypothetical protein AB0F77_24385 [Streptomyces sp. NPDC026672]|uniref:hypothetical protein n=1 Tax=unclassified Streptomyces TaxID=2593676 RepID=UPI0033F86CEC